MTSFGALVRSHAILSSLPMQRCRAVLLKNLQRKSSLKGYRQLFTPAALGLESYLQNKEKTELQFNVNMRERFRERMGQVLVSESHNMIFTEDLKNAVHLATTEEDVSLVLGMAKKFNTQHSGLRFGAYVFGPVVMRMFYHLNQPDQMLQALKMSDLDGFFDQLSSYQLAMDLLYENERYQDCLDVFIDLQEKRLTGVKYPRNCLTIALAACYKLNTPESYERMMNILEGTEEYGTNVNLRTILFAATLALKQNNPHICLEIIARANTVTHITVRNLRVMALTDLGRVEDALPVLRSVLQFDLPDTHRPGEGSRFLKETIQKVEQAVKGTGNKELIAEFQHVSRNLEDHNLISEKTLDKLVCEPIEAFKPYSSKQRDRAMLAASFNRNSRNQRQWQGHNEKKRPGLMEME